MNSKQIETYKDFLKRLEYYRKAKVIKVLHRGESKKFAFNRFKLSPKNNSVEQFAKRLFYYGEKSKYYWEQKIESEFNINSVDRIVFKYIFDKFGEIAKKTKVNRGTQAYRKKNKETFKYFSLANNKIDFVSKCEKLNQEKRRSYRNYYFRIIHQLGETDYKKKSLNISSTENLQVTNVFSNNEIVLNFWDFDFNEFDRNSGELPTFKGKPYKNQEEISLFSVIFPHYIHSFKIDNMIYCNPALFKERDLDSMILYGFDIDQKGFEMKFKNETNYKKGVQRTGSQYREI